MQSDGWRLKKRLTMPPVAPRRKARFVQAKVKRASLPLGDDDPMMERVAPTDGGFAPLTTSSSDDEAKPKKPTMARITPGAHDAPVQTEAAKEEAAEAEAAETKGGAAEKEETKEEAAETKKAKEKEETKEEAAETKKAKALDLLAHEPPLALPRTPSYEEEPGYEEELSEEAKSTDHIHERDTAEEMGHDE